MAIYLSSHPGVILTNVSSFNLQPENLRGYYSKNDLMSLLDNNPVCVGFRIYNVNPPTPNNNPQLLTVCVQGNGFDMQANGTHLICNPTDSPIINTSMPPFTLSPTATSHMGTRSDSYNKIKDAYSQLVADEEKFSSYFSRTMITNLMNGNPHQGICFYKVTIPSPSPLAGRSTHLAVSTDLDANGNIIGINSNNFEACMSNQPCPGHCINKTPSGDFSLIPDTEPFVNPQKDQLSDPYIPIWD